jgi:hypothetical protein
MGSVRAARGALGFYKFYWHDEIGAATDAVS